MKPGERTVEPQGRTRHGVLWSVLILVLVGVSGAGLWSWLSAPPTRRLSPSAALSRPPVYGSVPEFSLIERSGRQVQLSDLRDKIWIASFIFTNCTDECPLMSAQMAQLQAEHAETAALRLVSITVDPERDTPAVLSQYADRFGADPARWLFLTGEKAPIYQLAREGFRLGVVAPQEEGRGAGLTLASLGRGKDPAHAARFTLVDRHARIRGYYDSREEESLDRLREHVRALLKEE